MCDVVLHSIGLEDARLQTHALPKDLPRKATAVFKRLIGAHKFYMLERFLKLVYLHEGESWLLHSYGTRLSYA